jgi:excisionase family DNA binding protein
MPDVTDQLLVSIDEARAKLGGISRTTVYQLIDKGELVKVNIGSRGLITADSIDGYVRRLKEGQ